MASPPSSVRVDAATPILQTLSASSHNASTSEPRPVPMCPPLSPDSCGDTAARENAAHTSELEHQPCHPQSQDASNPATAELRAQLDRMVHHNASLDVSQLEAQLDQCSHAGAVGHELTQQVRTELALLRAAEAHTTREIAAVAQRLSSNTAHNVTAAPLDQLEAELANRDQRLAQIRAKLQRAEACAVPADNALDHESSPPAQMEPSDSFADRAQLEHEIVRLEAQLASIPPTPPRAAGQLALLRDEAAVGQTRPGAASALAEHDRTRTQCDYAQADVGNSTALLSRQAREGDGDEMEELDAAPERAHGGKDLFGTTSGSGPVSARAVSERRRAARRSWTPTARGRSASATPRFAHASDSEDMDDALSSSGSAGGRSVSSRRSSFASARSTTSRASSVGRHQQRPVSALGYKAADADPEVRGFSTAQAIGAGNSAGDGRHGHARSQSCAGTSAGLVRPGQGSGSRGPRKLALAARSRSGSFVAAVPVASHLHPDQTSDQLELKLLSLEREVAQLQVALRERDEELLHLNLAKRQKSQSPPEPEFESAPVLEVQLEPKLEPPAEADVDRIVLNTSAMSNVTRVSQPETHDEAPAESSPEGDAATDRRDDRHELLGLQVVPGGAELDALPATPPAELHSMLIQKLQRAHDDATTCDRDESHLNQNDTEVSGTSERASPPGPELLAKQIEPVATDGLGVQAVSERERRALEEAHAAMLAELEAKIAALVQEVEVAGSENTALHEVNVELVHRLQEQQGLDPREVAELRADGVAAHDALVVLENHVTELTAERDQLTTELNLVRENQAASSVPGGNDLLLRELEIQRDQSTRARKELTELKAAYNTLGDEQVRKDAALQDLSLKLKALMRQSAVADAAEKRLLLSPRVPPPTPPPSFPPPPVPVATPASRRASASVVGGGGRDSPASTYRTITPLGRYGTRTSESSGLSATTVPSSELSAVAPNGASADGTPGGAGTAAGDGSGTPWQRQLLDLEKRFAHTEADLRAHMDIVAMLEAALNDSERAVRRTRVQVAELTRERDQALALNEAVRAAHDAAQQELDAARVAARHSRSESDARLLQEQTEKDQIKARMARDMDEMTKNRTSRLFCI